MDQRNIKTLAELSEILDIAKDKLSSILYNQMSIDKSDIIKLCNTLQIDFEDILEDRDKVTNLYIEESRKEQFVDTSSVIANRSYNLVELFAGAGGLALGLEYAGFNEVGLVEVDKYACKTLRKNRPKWNVIEENIIQVAEVGIKKFLPRGIKIDIISGGYPCQAFSYAGHKMGLDDVRGTMFYYYAKILNELKPTVFLAENVKGLVSYDDGKTLKTMIDVFASIGYCVQYKVLNALDYNVAQKRERIIIIGIRNDIDIPYYYPKPYEYKLVLKDVLKNIPYSIGAKYPPKKKRVLDLVPAGGYWRDLPDDIAREHMGKSYYSGGGRTGMARRISWEEPCLT